MRSYPEGRQGVAVGAPGGDLVAGLVGRARRASQREGVRRGAVRGRLYLNGDRAGAAQLGYRLLRVWQGLAVGTVDVFHRGHAFALQCAGHDDGRHALGGYRLRVGGVDLAYVVAVDLDGLPAEGAGAGGVVARVPAGHRLPALPQAVNVDDSGEIVQADEAGVLERLPHGALGHLAVAAEDPDAVREPV